MPAKKLCKVWLCRLFGWPKISPSDIRFTTYDCGQILLEPEHLAVLTNRVAERGARLPKIQVTEKGGEWFALNNAFLHVLRELERQGQCDEVAVEVVPLKKVPSVLQAGMLSFRDGAAWGCDPIWELSGSVGTTCSSRSGYVKLDEPRIPPQSDSEGTSYYSTTDCSDFNTDDCESDYDDFIMCTVCDRNFNSYCQLTRHQERKGHFGCSLCDSVFPSVHDLEEHQGLTHAWLEEETFAGGEGPSRTDTSALPHQAEEMESLL